MRNAVDRELSSAPPRYDAKPARFALNQGSRKLCSGGVTCPGLIRCTGLDHAIHVPEISQSEGARLSAQPGQILARN